MGVSDRMKLYEPLINFSFGSPDPNRSRSSIHPPSGNAAPTGSLLALPRCEFIAYQANTPCGDKFSEPRVGQYLELRLARFLQPRSSISQFLVRISRMAHQLGRPFPQVLQHSFQPFARQHSRLCDPAKVVGCGNSCVL